MALLFMKSNKYDIGVCWTNPVEEKFVAGVKKAAQGKKLSLFEITYEDAEEALARIEQGKLRFGTFFDRASLDDSMFFLMAEKLKIQGVRVINDPAAAIQGSNKAILHELYVKNGLPVPQTIVISRKTPKKEFEQIPKKLGIPFVLKPSHGGGGEGVQLAGKNTKDIEEFLGDLAADKGLAQEYVVPVVVSEKIAWFRPVYVVGKVIPLWWDPHNHFYQEFGDSKEENMIAQKLTVFAKKIAQLTGLERFSYELMIAEKERYLIVDYVNHPIDLNTQEAVEDGLPPAVLEKIVRALLA